MSNELTGKNGKIVGTHAYFEAVHHEIGVGQWINRTASHPYESMLSGIAKQVNGALRKLHLDLDEQGEGVSLIPEADRNAAMAMVAGMREVCAFAKYLSIEAEICTKALSLRGICTRARTHANNRQVAEKVKLIIKSNSASISVRDRLELAKKLIASGGKYKAGKGDNKDQFLATLSDGKGLEKKFWEEVVRQAEYENKPASALVARYGAPLCSKLYLRHIEEEAFNGLISTNNRQYKQEIFRLLYDIIGIIEKDIVAGLNTDHYVIYEKRARIGKQLDELGKYVKIPAVIKLNLARLRRLEHFDNKVIVLKKDTSLPVSAELEWAKGKNILNIYANIHFIVTYGQTDTAARKKSALDGFMKWEGNYKVFYDQPVEVKIHLNVKHPDTEIATWGGRMMSLEKGYTNVALITEASREDMIAMLARASINGATPGGLMKYLKAGEGFANNVMFQRSFAFRKKDFLGLEDDGNLMGLDYTLPNKPDLGVDVAKHEFGHILGLGDMYKDDENFPFLEMKGADKTIAEVANIYWERSDKNGNPIPIYDSVMGNNGNICNNDIEMVIEAFHTGKRQNFQKQDLFGDEISTVLNKGN